MPTTTQPAASPTATSALVDRFLSAVERGEPSRLEALYAPTATLDATVPGWRFEVSGPAAIVAQYAGWFTHPGRLEELRRRATADGEVVTYVLGWEEGGVPHAAHHCHVLTVDDGRIVHEQVWCGGRWPAALLAEMEAARHAR
jgi:hypothetical protein